jgi:cysteine desulfurase/selenocysteine lyase
MEAVQAHERELVSYAMARLSELKGLRILGPATGPRGGLVAFTLGEIHPHDIAGALDSLGIAVRAGHHCAQPLHERFGIPASTRASFYIYNNEAEADLLVAGLQKVIEFFSS